MPRIVPARLLLPVLVSLFLCATRCARAESLPTPPAVTALLQQHGIPDTLSGLHVALSNPDPAIRGVVATLLVWKVDRDALPLLRAALAAEQHPATRDLLAGAIATLNTRLVLRFHSSSAASLPASLSLTITNTGDQAVALPVPTHCNDAANGSVQLRLRELPAATAGQVITACFIDSIYVDIRRRAAGWKRLRPHEALTITQVFDEIFPPPHPAGTYDLSAEYTAPFVSFDDLTWLLRARIAMPVSSLLSDHLSFQQP